MSMNHTIDTIDTLIAQKRQELKDIIQDELDDLESLRHRMASPTAVAHRTDPIVVTGRLPDMAAPSFVKPPSEPAPTVNRLAAIAKAAKRAGKTAKRYTPEQKFAILDEYEYAAVKQAVLTRHGVSYGSIQNWLEAISQGRLVRP